MSTVLAPAKVNLCLFLGPTRPSDGRHELLTVFSALTLADRLDVRFGVDRDEVICPGVQGPNLATRALELLRADGWDAPAVRITIEKRIPVAAGMGGGSADAAAVLALASADGVRRVDLAQQLGADVAALIAPGLWLGRGAGDEGLAHFPAGLGEHAYVVVPSTSGLSTPAVYREADRLGLPRRSEDLEALAPQVRRGLADGGRFPAELIVNDLAPAALSLCPSIAEALHALMAAGAAEAIVSGSGPTTVGIWWGPGAGAAAQTAAAELSSRYPGAVAALPWPGPSQSGPSL